MRDKASTKESFQEFLALELEILQEKLLQRYEQGNLPCTRSQPSDELADCARRADEQVKEAAGLCASLQPPKGDTGDANSDCDFSTRDSSKDACDPEAVQAAEQRWARLTSKLVDCDESQQTVALQSTWSGLVNSARSGVPLISQADWTPHQAWLNPWPGDNVRPRQCSRPSTLFRETTTISFGEELTSKRNCFKRLALHPEARVRFFWCMFGSAMLLFDAVFIPLEAVDIVSQHWSINVLILAYWMVDMALQFVTGFATDKHTEMRMSKIFRSYLRGWFFPDLFMLMLDVLVIFAAVSPGFRAVRFLRLLRLIRLMRFHKLTTAAGSYVRRVSSDHMLSLFKLGWLLVMILLVSHYVACGWYGISYWENGMTWRQTYFGDKESGGKLHEYAVAMHWAVTQFTPATNDINPTNAVERCFAIFVVILGMVVFSSFISSVAGTVHEFKMLGVEKLKMRGRILEFFRAKKISGELGCDIIHSFDKHFGKSSRLATEQDLLPLLELPENMRISLHGEIFGKWLETHSIMPHLNSADWMGFAMICHKVMMEKSYLPHEDIFMDNQRCTKAHIVIDGRMRYSNALGTSEVRRGMWMSEGALWLNWRHVGTLCADGTASQVAELDSKRFRKVIMDRGGLVFRIVRTYAMLFVHFAESEASNNFTTDMPFSEEVQHSLARRAVNFSNLNISVSAGMSSVGFEEFRAPRASWAEPLHRCSTSASWRSNESPLVL